MKDLLIIPSKSGEVTFDVYGTTTAYPLHLLQSLYICQLSDNSSPYRPVCPMLLSLLKACNTPTLKIYKKMLNMSAKAAVNMLDKADRANIKSYTAACDDQLNVYSTLTLKDGTKITKEIANE